jgi:hypothetical protein
MLRWGFPVQTLGKQRGGRKRKAFPTLKRRRDSSSGTNNDQDSSSEDEPRVKKLKAENARLQELVNKQAESTCALTSRK